MDEQARYDRAKRRVRAIRGFYIHLAVYLLTNLTLVLINLATTSYFWALWPMLGWGIGLLSHAVGVFGFGGWFGKEWEERQIHRLMERDL